MLNTAITTHVMNEIPSLTCDLKRQSYSNKFSIATRVVNPVSHSNHANITRPTNPRKQQINVEEKALITGNQTSMRSGWNSITSHRFRFIWEPNLYHLQFTNDNPFTFSNCQQFKLVHLSKIYWASQRTLISDVWQCKKFMVQQTRGWKKSHHHYFILD